MGRKRNTEKPKWLEEKEAQNRTSPPGRRGSGNGAGLKQTVAQASASSAKAESITTTVTPASTGYNTQQQKPEDVLHGATKGWNGGSGGGVVVAHSSFPKWTYIPLTLAAAGLLYLTAAATNTLPSPLEIARYFRPAHTVTTPSASTPKQDEQPQLNGKKQQAYILNIVNSELSRLRSFPEMPQLASVADTIEATLGQDGYTSTEAAIMSTIRQVAEMAASRKIPNIMDDLKITLRTESYQSSTITFGGRSLEFIVLTSDPERAQFYFDSLQRIIPKVEAFTRLKYDKPILVIHSQPNKDFGAAFAVENGITTAYPDSNQTVVRRYEVTTEKRAVEENMAHEFDHLISNLSNLPVWLAEGKANFTSYHALRTNSGLPTDEEPFEGYRANLELNVKNRFNGVTPSISEYEGDYAAFAARNMHPSTVTGLGELLLEDIFRIVGPQNMSDIIKELNAKSFVDKGVFYNTVLTHTPLDLQQNMNAFLKERYEGAK